MKQKTRKAQVFTGDFILGFLIFIGMLLIGIKLVIGIIPSTQYDILYADNTFLSEQLLQPGYPANWTTSDVIIPGLTTNNRLNLTKLQNFSALTYDQTRSLYHLTGDYIFYFKNTTDIINMTSCIYGYNIPTDGNCTPDLSAALYDDLVKTERLIVYNSSILTMVVLSWQ